MTQRKMLLRLRPLSSAKKKAVLATFAALIAVFMGSGPAVALYLDYRPKNFFASLWQKDQAVCGTIFQSLNKENRLPQDINRVANANFITDLLLASDLEVQWERRPFNNRGHSEQIDYTSVDLANDGRSVSVIRWDFWDSFGNQNVLLIPPIVPAEVTSDQPLPDDIVAKLFGAEAKNELKIKPSTSDFWKRGPYPTNGRFNLNLLKVGKKAFLLAAGSESTESAVEHGSSFDAFVMEYRSAHDIPVVCHFRAGERK